MYKTKLQELCHKRKWGLPKYSAMKDGPDHMPSFNASVYVNGVTFNCSGALSSLKEAQNQAAMLAFLSFTSAARDTKEHIGAVKPHDIPISAQSPVIKDDKNRFCKNPLQNNAQRNNIDPHVFTCKTEDTYFKATVQLNGESLGSPAFFNTVEEADQAAAKLDLLSLLPDLFEKGDSNSFKTSLLKLTEREGLCEPTYNTMQIGSSYMPTFFSTVVVEGVEFHGKGGRSKKLAEEDAAKIAYIALKECGLNMYAAFSPSHPENEALQSIHTSHVKCMNYLNLEDELLDLDLNETLLANDNVSNEVHNHFLSTATRESANEQHKVIVL